MARAPRTRPAVLAFLAAGALGVVAPREVSSDHTKEAGNVVVTVEDDWRFSDSSPEWAKDKIVLRAFRRLVKLKKKDPATGEQPDAKGEGGEILISNVEAPAGKSLQEIAEVQGCALGTVKSSLHRAVMTLRERLSDLFPGPGRELQNRPS